MIQYPGELTTRTVDFSTSEIMWSSVTSTRGARYMTADAGNFYLATPMEHKEYLQTPIALSPQESIDKCVLHGKVKNWYAYCEIVRGMYGLPQAGILANKLFKKRLKVHDYYKVPHTTGLFTHKNRPIWFTRTVDDFRVKYIGREHAEHLMTVLKQHYKMEEDWKGELCCGITLKWDYAKGYVDIPMPNYVHKKLIEYKHKTPKCPQNCP